ncbi:MAG: hypothetical protein WD060_07660 [Pirellulales bacterium]
MLPEFLRPLFWDCDLNALDQQRDGDFVIGRVLASGTWDAIQWLRREWGDAAIRDHIIRHCGRSLSSEQLRLWQVLVGLPDDAVVEWLASPERRIWEQAGVS